ncbi:hypothetical protein Enr13x_24260 [Stieleria neptunia]|uniref:Zinc-ribbon domain-containing protein n=1 Tax=Stieleria neptunia TaxID=2527979 RepID=A0A518HP12_9BACT|nr:hypothetical protein Enr13x_24260 [Stieleria neptunia]
MPIIACPECSNNLSEFAESCPKCGVALTAEMIETQKKEADDCRFIGGAVLGAFLLFVFIVAIFGGGKDEAKEPATRPAFTTRSVSSAPRTALGTPSHSREKHLQDARELVMRGARAAVRNGQMTRREFEEYTGVAY